MPSNSIGDELVHAQLSAALFQIAILSKRVELLQTENAERNATQSSLAASSIGLVKGALDKDERTELV